MMVTYGVKNNQTTSIVPNVLPDGSDAESVMTSTYSRSTRRRSAEDRNNNNDSDSPSNSSGSRSGKEYYLVTVPSGPVHFHRTL